YKIDTVKEMKPERMLCQLYGRLILILINTMINMAAKTMYWRDYGVDISDFKAHKILRDVDHLQWMKELKKTAARLYYVLKKCFKKIWRFGKKSKRKGRVNYGMGVLTRWLWVTTHWRTCLALLETGNYYLFQLLLFLLKKSNQKSSPLQRRFSSRTGFSKKYSCFHTPLLDSWVVLVLILFLTYAFHLAPRAGI